jgi:hypothetical protein
LRSISNKDIKTSRAGNAELTPDRSERRQSWQSQSDWADGIKLILTKMRTALRYYRISNTQNLNPKLFVINPELKMAEGVGKKMAHKLTKFRPRLICPVFARENFK